MTQPATHRRREGSSHLMSVMDGDRLVALADDVLAAGPRLEVTRRPQTGAVVLQAREPVARQRFQLADVLVSTAGVDLDGHPGWGMRMGSDRRAALAQAVCDAELARDGRYAAAIHRVLDEVAQARRRARAEEWRRLVPTIVEFEEVL